MGMGPIREDSALFQNVSTPNKCRAPELLRQGAVAWVMAVRTSGQVMW